MCTDFHSFFTLGAWPPRGAPRIVTVVTQTHTLRLIWSGNTWAFRDAMDEAGVKGAL